MKTLGTLLAGALTLLILVAVGAFMFMPADTGAEAADIVVAGTPTLVPPAAPAPPSIEAELARREETYQAQMAQLDQTLQERHTAYQSQIQQIGGQLATAQHQLDQLQVQAEAFAQQAAQLEATRAERLGLYQTQLEQARRQYETRFAEIQQAIGQVQGQLAEANAQLGR